jgi:hypothetical protein
MGFLGALFGGKKKGSTKDRLIRALVKKRLLNDPMAVAAAYGPEMVDGLPEAVLIGLPEATIVSIVETYSAISALGVDHLDILARIEAHRSMLGSAELPRPATVETYIAYRLALEHTETFVPPNHVHDCVLLTQRLFPYEEPVAAVPAGDDVNGMPLSGSMPDVTQRQPLAIYGAGDYVLLVVEGARALAERLTGERMPIDYLYVMTVLRRSSMKPQMFVTLERGLAERTFLCAFNASSEHINLGDGSSFSDIDSFSKAAIEHICRELALDARHVRKEAP